GTNTLTVSDIGAATFKNSTNSTSAFQVQPSGSTTPVFNVDTTNNRVGIGTASPGYKLHVVQSAQADTEGLAIFEGTNSIHLYNSTGNNGYLDFAVPTANIRNTAGTGLINVTSVRTITISSTQDNNAGINIDAGGVGNYLRLKNNSITRLTIDENNVAYFGKGITDAAPTAFTLQATGGSGSNIAGASFTLAGGRGTGNAVGGSITFQYAPAGGAGSTLNALQTACVISGTNGSLSCPGGGSNSERFGAGSTTTNNSALAVGYNASAGLDGVAIGNSAAAVTSGTAIGVSANAAGGYSLAAGQSSSTTGNGGTALGYQATAGAEAIALGTGATATANQFVVNKVTSGYFGNGVTHATPTAFTLQSTGGSGTDIAGANFTLAGGKGTGTGLGGSLLFQTAPAAGSTGSGLNALVSRLEIQSNGNALFGLSDTTGTLVVVDIKSDAGDPTGVNGGIYYNSNAGKFRCYQAAAWTDCIGAGGGSGDSITVNSTVATDANFLNTAASASVAGTTFAVNTATSPDDITLTVSDASGTLAGVVTANAQTFGGNKTFTGLITGQLGLTVTGAAVSLNDASNFATSINTTGSTGAVSIGNTAAGTILIQSGSSINLDGAVATTVTVGSTTQTGQITIGRSTATNTVSIGSANGTASTQTISIGGGTSTTSGGKVVNIADGVPGAGTTNTVTIGSAGTTTGTVGVTVGSIGGAAHITTIQGGNGATALNLLAAASGNINIATNAVTGKVVNIGSVGTTANATTIHIADSTDATVAQSVTIGSTNNAGSTLTLQAGSTSGVTVKTSASATSFQVQNASNNTVLGVNTSTNQVLIGKASTVLGSLVVYNATNSNTITIQSGTTAASGYTLTLPTTAGIANQCLQNSATAGVLTFASCGGAGTSKVTLSPEFHGAVLTADGTNNVGTMTSDFCSKGNTNPPDINTTICATNGDYRTYYSWTANATNDYDIYVTWQVPSDFVSFTTSPAISFYGWRTSTSDNVTLTLYDDAGGICGAATAISGTVATWNSTNYATASGCGSIAAGDRVTFRVQLSVGVNAEFARMGEIIINYNK
ncbi:hypothetical protein H0V99_00735, partial [Candidatus Saccharibacteria bacterium]|nr:hypothetical protein [Candidatus Saccharibacteria bacterium]